MEKTKKSASPRKPRTKKPKILEHPRSSAAEFTNREVGWLNFNIRVLTEAEDARNPLLERVRFLAICNSNLDEFIMKRVGRLKRHVAFGLSPKSSDGQTPAEQLKLIRVLLLPILQRMAECFKNLRQQLVQNQVHLLSWKDLSVKEKEQIKKYYIKNVFPVLTPLSVDPGHPFPFISNLSTSLAVTLKSPDKEEKLFARIKIPKVLPQWIRVEPEGASEVYRYVSLIEVIQENLADLFPSMQVLQVMPFRLTRNADIDRDEEDAEDLLQLIEEELRQRRFAEVVRLEHGPNPDPWMLQFLKDELELADEDLYQVPAELDYTDLNVFADLPLPHLKFDPHSPVVPPAFADESQSIFGIVRHQDVLLHHPFESFNMTVERFIREAASDPKVLAIKMTLYRTGDNSPFIKALIRAAEQGKQVVCLIELKARFDEERNIHWAQELENAGVHVVYGVVGLKTHAKIALVVRQEAEGLRCYAYI